MQVALATQLLPPTLRLALTTGLMGGLTTYSTLNYETLRFFQEGSWLFGFVNILVTVLACLASGVLGLFGARWAIGG
jgi:CrcB protein